MRTLGRWHYCIRIESSLILTAPECQRLCKVRDVQLSPGETHCLHNITLTRRHFGPVQVALGRPTEGPEQWQIVSDEPTNVETFTECGERFQIEEGFLNEKSGLFGLEDSRLRDAASLERLILVLSVAPLLLVSEGTEVVQRGDRACRQSPLASLKIGLRAVHHALSRDQAIFSQCFEVGLTLNHRFSENALLPLRKSLLKLAGSSFSVRPHKICQAARPAHEKSRHPKMPARGREIEVLIK